MVVKMEEKEFKKNKDAELDSLEERYNKIKKTELIKEIIFKEKELFDLKESLENQEEELKKIKENEKSYKEQLIRMQADFENYKNEKREKR